MKETPVNFESSGKKLYGIISEPENASSDDTAVVFLHGWATYRIGPHRFFVELAREMAGKGYLSLRFDFRGRGESEGDCTVTGLSDMIDDAEAAVRWLKSEYNCSKIVLAGLCSGGEVAVGAAAELPDCIDSLVLLSAPLLGRRNTVKDDMRKTADSARKYRHKLFMPETWKKFVHGNIHFKGVLNALFGHFGRQNRITASRETVLIGKFRENYRNGVLFIYGGSDPEAPASEKAY